jgi:hypothetical protein
MPRHSAAFFGSDTRAESSAVAFGNLVDFARLQVVTPTAEICDACNTINMGSARTCKCCSHRLPAFYAVRHEGTQALRSYDAVLPWRLFGRPSRASLMDFAAFSLVINLLVLMTAYIPVP